MQKTKPRSTPVPYNPDSCALFSTVRRLPGAVFLDSCAQQTGGRYDILAALPHAEVKTLDALDAQLKHHACVDHGYPFHGGAIGFFSYDLGRCLEKLPVIAEKKLAIPDLQLGFYDMALVVDHQTKTSQLISYPICSDTSTRLAKFEAALAQPAPTPSTFTYLSKFTSNTTRKNYEKSFQSIQAAIQAGDCYQANLSHCFSASVQGDPWIAYQTLRQQNPAPFCAFVGGETVSILSTSPERFLQVIGKQVLTQPIKGTIARSTNPIDDQQAQQQLLASEKDRAENLMIVDLLRNDLSRCCQPGSVQVPHLFALETFASVHHLVSTVTGTLMDNTSLVDLLRVCFPGGSITGTPKISAMKLIESLEPERRGIYCGAIGYLDYAGRMDLNIAIRTLTHVDNQLYCSTGGAIVADSDCDAEYAETLAKVQRLIN